MAIDKSTGEVIIPFIRTAYNYDTNEASLESALQCEDVTRTQQNFKEECDINTIVRRFGLTGGMPEKFQMPTNIDISEMATDYHTALNAVRQAGEEFMRLPAHIRKRFDNDPQKLIYFLGDEGNRIEAEKLGLVEPKAPEPPAPPAPETSS